MLSRKHKKKRKLKRKGFIEPRESKSFAGQIYFLNADNFARSSSFSLVEDFKDLNSGRDHYRGLLASETFV